jgi:hypothetical protein
VNKLLLAVGWFGLTVSENLGFEGKLGKLFASTQKIITS